MPAAAPLTVSVLLPGGVTGLGLKEAVGPAGLKAALRVTGAADTRRRCPTVTATVALLPWQISWLAGAAAMVKSGVPHDGNLKEPMRVYQL